MLRYLHHAVAQRSRLRQQPAQTRRHVKHPAGGPRASAARLSMAYAGVHPQADRKFGP